MSLFKKMLGLRSLDELEADAEAQLERGDFGGVDGAVAARSDVQQKVAVGSLGTGEFFARLLN